MQLLGLLIVECAECNVEAAVLLDASSKSSNNDWLNMLNFVNTVAGTYNINQQCVRVAVVHYAQSAFAPITLNRYNDINSLRQAVSALTIIGGGSNLAEAFRLLRNSVFSRNFVRSGARLIAIVLTDRLSCSNDIRSEAATLQRMNVEIIAIGVMTGRVESSCLTQIVSNRQSVEVPSYSLLSTYASLAARYACPTATTSK